MASDDCYWSLTSRHCLDKPPPSSPGIFSTRAPPPDSLCGMMPSEMTCNLSTACYWSPLTRRCEKLLFGTMDWLARH